MWSGPFFDQFPARQDPPQSPVSQWLPDFPDAMSRTQASSSQTTRATNCANPGYRIQLWPRLFPTKSSPWRIPASDRVSADDEMAVFPHELHPRTPKCDAVPAHPRNEYFCIIPRRPSKSKPFPPKNASRNPAASPPPQSGHPAAAPPIFRPAGTPTAGADPIPGFWSSRPRLPTPRINDRQAGGPPLRGVLFSPRPYEHLPKQTRLEPEQNLCYSTDIPTRPGGSHLPATEKGPPHEEQPPL